MTHPAREKAATYKTVISHLTVELPEQAMRYTDCPNVTKSNGVWPACGINEANVAMTATETITSNARVVGADPYVRYQEKKGRNTKEVPGGIGEEDLVTLVLPYIHSAREGVLRTGALLEQYGTYEPNGMAFADANEVWWLETIGGHHWIARRVPDDRVVIMPNQFGLDHLTLRTLTGSRRNTFAPRICGSLWKSTIWRWIRARTSTRGWHSVPIPTPTIFTTRPAPGSWAGISCPAPIGGMGTNAGLHPGERRHPLVLCAGAEGDGGGCAVSAGVRLSRERPIIPMIKTPRARGSIAPSACPTAMSAGLCRLRRAARGHPGRGVAVHGRQRFYGLLPGICQCDQVPEVPSGTTETVSTDSMYWHSRLIAALTDAQFGSALILDERYLNAVMNRGQQFLYEYDEKIRQGAPVEVLQEANRKIAEMVKEESDKALAEILKNASEHMKIRYHRGDNGAGDPFKTKQHSPPKHQGDWCCFCCFFALFLRGLDLGSACGDPFVGLSGEGTGPVPANRRVCVGPLAGRAAPLKGAGPVV